MPDFPGRNPRLRIRPPDFPEWNPRLRIRLPDFPGWNPQLRIGLPEFPEWNQKWRIRLSEFSVRNPRLWIRLSDLLVNNQQRQIRLLECPECDQRQWIGMPKFTEWNPQLRIRLPNFSEWKQPFFSAIWTFWLTVWKIFMVYFAITDRAGQRLTTPNMIYVSSHANENHSKTCKVLRVPYTSYSACGASYPNMVLRVMADFHDKFPQRLEADDGDRQATSVC